MNAVQCDYCGKFAPNPLAHYRDQFGGPLPSGWFTVSVIDGKPRDALRGGGLDEFGEFCSRDCVSEHFGRARREVAA